MWNNTNKIGHEVTGCELINYSELYHPLSLHNIVTGKDRLY
jgi:hypothetical protein